MRRFARWTLVGLGASLLVWLPPVVQQLTTAHGNLALLFNYFTHPPQAPVGLSQGIRVVLAHLNPVAPFTKALVPTGGNFVGAGSAIPGAVFLAAWAVTAVVAWRRRLHPLIELDAVLAIAVVLGTASSSRIFGLLWYYLLLWGWIVDGLMILAVGWTVVIVLNDRLRAELRRRLEAIGGLGLGAFIVAMTVLFAVEASSVQMPTPFLAAELRTVVSPTVRALDDHVGPANGRSGRYLVTFTDPNSLGSQAFGLVNELERSGFQVGMTNGFRSEIAPHRVLDPEHATALVHLAVGSDIATWRAKPDSIEVAYSDPRSASERAEYAVAPPAGRRGAHGRRSRQRGAPGRREPRRAQLEPERADDDPQSAGAHGRSRSADRRLRGAGQPRGVTRLGARHLVELVTAEAAEVVQRRGDPR